MPQWPYHQERQSNSNHTINLARLRGENVYCNKNEFYIASRVCRYEPGQPPMAPESQYTPISIKDKHTDETIII
jgi:hypothetical protein